ncbi:MAG: hypothetical protein FWF29_08115 [Treponema sp.]|nr:hypothetical protein [Treponema sp.]
MMLEQSVSSAELEKIRARINDRDYLYEAIQRMAQVLSNELIDFTKGGKENERRRKGR